MAVLVTMEVGPVEWDKFRLALEWGKTIAAPGRRSIRVYRGESDPTRVLVVEEWDSHDSMHRYQARVGADFNKRAGTEGMEWQSGVWEQTSF
jgi:quinol monooxygenase YgiN